MKTATSAQVDALQQQLSVLRVERDRVLDALEAKRRRHRERRQAWADDRRKLVRSLDAQVLRQATPIPCHAVCCVDERSVIVR